MNTFIRNISFIFLLITISLIISCEKESNPTSKAVSIELIKIEKSRIQALNTDIVEFEYNKAEKSLLIFHHNTALSYNSKVSLSLSVIDNLINIVEDETVSNSDRLELYTISYKIKNIPAQSFKLKIVEPYVKLNKDKLEFTIDLSNNEKGNFYIKRNFYPWGN